jgi:hypothetical protein
MGKVIAQASMSLDGFIADAAKMMIGQRERQPGRPPQPATREAPCIPR